jgi:serine protease Do
VAPGGYVLTNHHVIEGPGKVLVQLPGQKEPAPAQVAAKDGDQDLALLKVKVPQGVPWKPLALSSVDLSRGAKVGAFGFAVAGTVGAGLKLTTGVVSSLADQSTQGMLLLDCRVNPGNSGGPLCDSHGNVVGMVTAKSVSGFGIESYGMALPAESLRVFLTKHLPGYAKQPTGPSGAQVMEWDQIDRLVGPSVLLIIRSR